ncbi:hypothetical protein [Bdellovibrio sp. HCB288]|uniref:hypothetical protein n=1 Tax=Bdellovibrio sp. HCB288 TaxID=3394355 RepID=UPI0039B64127
MSGIKNFIKLHWEKLIFLNCIGAFLALYTHDILFTLDGGGRYVSGKDLLEVGYHGFNDHYFMGGIQNLFYPPLHDFLLAAAIKFNEWILFGALNERLLYSAFVFGIFTFFIYSLYRVSRSFQNVFAKIFFVIFASWPLYLNIYSFEKKFGYSLNFYKTPYTVYFQGLTLHDIFVTGITNQFLSAGFLVLGILSIQKKNKYLTALWISLTILSHFVFGLVIVLIYAIKKIFEKDFRTLFAVGLASLGLTAFFLVPMIANGKYLITINSIPIRTGFWLSIVGFSFLFYKSKTYSYYLSFAAFILVSLIGISKLAEKYDLAFIPFHYYRLLFVSLLVFVFATAFALNEPLSRLRKGLILSVFLVAWIMNFGGHFTLDNLFDKYEPEVVSIAPEKQNDFSLGRTYFFGITRGVDFASEITLHRMQSRSFFTKGLYWESAPANRLTSSALFFLTGPPSVMEDGFDDPFHNKTCQIMSCFFRSFLNQSVATEVFMPPKYTVVEHFWQGMSSRSNLVSCYDTILKDLGEKSGQLAYDSVSLDRYLNKATGMVRTLSTNFTRPSSQYFLDRCTADINDDGRVPVDQLHKISRVSSGDYEIFAPDTNSSLLVSLQYFPGFKYEANGLKNLLPEDSPSAGMILKGSGTMKLSYSRTPLMWISYFISALAWSGMLVMGLAHIRRRIRSDK